MKLFWVVKEIFIKFEGFFLELGIVIFLVEVKEIYRWLSLMLSFFYFFILEYG